MLHLDTTGGALFQHLFEQNPLMRDVLIDDPQPVTPCRYDKAVVNLAQRAQVAEDLESRSLDHRARRKYRPVRIGHPHSLT